MGEFMLGYLATAGLMYLWTYRSAPLMEEPPELEEILRNREAARLAQAGEEAVLIPLFQEQQDRRAA